MKCPNSKTCKYFEDNSYMCNYNGGGDYCGEYRKSKSLFKLSLFMFLVGALFFYSLGTINGGIYG